MAKVSRVCFNCLRLGAANVEVGPEKSITAYERWRDTVLLCPPCQDALVAGDFKLLHERYVEERHLTREDFDS